MDGITDSIDTDLSKLQEIVKDGGVSATIHGVTKSWTRLNRGKVSWESLEGKPQIP